VRIRARCALPSGIRRAACDHATWPSGMQTRPLRGYGHVARSLIKSLKRRMPDRAWTGVTGPARMLPTSRSWTDVAQVVHRCGSGPAQIDVAQILRGMPLRHAGSCCPRAGTDTRFAPYCRRSCRYGFVGEGHRMAVFSLKQGEGRVLPVTVDEGRCPSGHWQAGPGSDLLPVPRGWRDATVTARSESGPGAL
jgi:hypothetical protein